jgi:hypothetical protein
MSKITLRIPLYPKQPKKFIDLMKKVVEKHEEDGASSLLNNPDYIDMADFKAKLLQAEGLRKESLYHRAQAEIKMEESKNILGTGKGSSIDLPDTLYHMLNKIKRLLLVKFTNEPMALAEYGFDVVVDTAKGVGRPKKKKNP